MAENESPRSASHVEKDWLVVFLVLLIPVFVLLWPIQYLLQCEDEWHYRRLDALAKKGKLTFALDETGRWMIHFEPHSWREQPVTTDLDQIVAARWTRIEEVSGFADLEEVWFLELSNRGGGTMVTGGHPRDLPDELSAAINARNLMKRPRDCTVGYKLTNFFGKVAWIGLLIVIFFWLLIRYDLR